MLHYTQVIPLVILLRYNSNIHCNDNQTTVTENDTEIDDITTVSTTAISESYEELYTTENFDKTTSTVHENVTLTPKGELSPVEMEMYNICPFYKINKINLDKMVDVWQTVFYQAPDKVPCFKMLIKKLGEKDRILNEQIYGTFGTKVFWDNCTLEIKADETGRKHYLQETHVGNGILQNIIIEKGNKTRLIIESPDQWFVQNNLLLTKDCSSGHVVVFSRVPFLPSRGAITEGLRLIGAPTDGKWTCDETLTTAHDKDVDFEIFGDITEFSL